MDLLDTEIPALDETDRLRAHLILVMNIERPETHGRRFRDWPWTNKLC